MELDINIVATKMLWNKKIKEFSEKDQTLYKKIQDSWNKLSDECQFVIVGNVGSYLSKCVESGGK